MEFCRHAFVAPCCAAALHPPVCGERRRFAAAGSYGDQLEVFLQFGRGKHVWMESNRGDTQ